MTSIIKNYFGLNINSDSMQSSTSNGCKQRATSRSSYRSGGPRNVIYLKFHLFADINVDTLNIEFSHEQPYI